MKLKSRVIMPEMLEPPLFAASPAVALASTGSAKPSFRISMAGSRILWLLLVCSVPLHWQGARADFDTAVFTAKNEYCSKLAASGRVVVDRALVFDRAVLRAIEIWKDDVGDRYVFRNRVMQEINAEGCGTASIPAPPSPRPYVPPVRGTVEPQYGGACVAVINGVRVGGCSGRF